MTSIAVAVSTPLPAASPPPALLGTSAAITASGASIGLDFTTAMMAGSGTIWVTDGALQTVIDRATGLPTLRIVGATDTHAVALSSVVFDGSHVRIDVAGLLAGRDYSVVMDAGVLQSSQHLAFGGVRGTDQVQFATPLPQPEPEPEPQPGPTLLSCASSGDLLAGGGGIVVTLSFSTALASLPLAALSAQNAVIGTPVSGDGGLSWTVTLAPPPNPIEAAGNVLRIDMGKVVDRAGHAGSGSSDLAAYAVDTLGPSATIALDADHLEHGGAIGVTIRLSERIAGNLDGVLATPHATLSDLASNDGLTWTAVLRLDDGAVSSGNVVRLDLAGLRDLQGNAGSGSAVSAAYATDGSVAAHVLGPLAIADYDGPFHDDYITDSPWQQLSGALSAPLGEREHLELRIDGVLVDAAQVQVDGLSWSWWGETYFDEGAHAFSARVVDADGRASAAIGQQFTVDLTAPGLLSPPDGAQDVDSAGDIVLVFDDAMFASAGEGRAAIELVDAEGNGAWIGLDDVAFSSDRKTLTIHADRHHLQAGRDYTLVLPANLTDLAGNAVEDKVLHLRTAGLDTVKPSALAATAQAPSGAYGIGAAIDIKVDFSEAVALANGPAPVLHLNNGASAIFAALAADGRSMTFTYLVDAEDRATDRLGLAESHRGDLAGRVRDLAGNVLDGAHVDYAYLDHLGGDGRGIAIDTARPAAPAAPRLDAGSDSGVAGDGVTSVGTPLLAGGGAEAGATILLYDGEMRVGATRADAEGAWRFDAVAFGDGEHLLTVRQRDAAGNLGAASQELALTVDTAAPTLVGKTVVPQFLHNLVRLEFSEAIALGTGALDVRDAAGHLASLLGFRVVDNAAGLHSVLEMDLGILGGALTLQLGAGAVHDAAGNVAIVGAQDLAFTIALPL